MPTSYLPSFNQLKGAVTSDAFKTSSDFLKHLTGFTQSNRASALSKTSLEIQQAGLASGAASAIGAFEFNSVIEQQKLADNLNALRMNIDAITSQQRAEIAGRGLTSSRSGLLFLSETLSRGERATLEIKNQAENIRRGSKMALESTLTQIRASKKGLDIVGKQQERTQRRKKVGNLFDTLSAGASAISAISGLFD